MVVPGLTGAPTELPGDATCLRVIRQDLRNFFDAGTGLPNHKAFEPSSEDKKHIPVRVSVFDEERTTPAQAVAIRRYFALKPQRYVVYGLDVEDAIAAGMAYDIKVRVVRDLEHLVEAVATMPGADGHCGIEGLETEAAKDPDTARALRDELAFQCVEMYRESDEQPPGDGI